MTEEEAAVAAERKEQMMLYGLAGAGVAVAGGIAYWMLTTLDRHGKKMARDQKPPSLDDQYPTY